MAATHFFPPQLTGDVDISVDAAPGQEYLRVFQKICTQSKRDYNPLEIDKCTPTAVELFFRNADRQRRRRVSYSILFFLRSQVKAAEAEAESKYLSGVGVSRQRKAIVDGLRDSVQTFSETIDGGLWVTLLEHTRARTHGRQ